MFICRSFVDGHGLVRVSKGLLHETRLQRRMREPTDRLPSLRPSSVTTIRQLALATTSRPYRPPPSKDGLTPASTILDGTSTDRPSVRRTRRCSTHRPTASTAGRSRCRRGRPPPPLVHSSDGSNGRRGLTDLDSVSPPMSPRLHDRSSRAAKMEALAHPVPYREHHQLPTAASATARLLHHQQQQQHSPSSEHRCPPPPNVTVLQPSFGNPMLSYIYSAAAAAAAAAHQLHHPHFGHMMLNGAGAPDAGQSPPSHHPEASPFLFPLPTAQSSLATEANFAAAAAAAGLQLNPALMLGCSQLASLNPWLYPSYLAAFGGVHNPGLMDNGVPRQPRGCHNTRGAARAMPLPDSRRTRCVTTRKTVAAEGATPCCFTAAPVRRPRRSTITAIITKFRTHRASVASAAQT